MTSYSLQKPNMEADDFHECLICCLLCHPCGKVCGNQKTWQMLSASLPLVPNNNARGDEQHIEPMHVKSSADALQIVGLHLLCFFFFFSELRIPLRNLMLLCLICPDPFRWTSPMPTSMVTLDTWWLVKFPSGANQEWSSISDRSRAGKSKTKWLTEQNVTTQHVVCSSFYKMLQHVCFMGDSLWLSQKHGCSNKSGVDLVQQIKGCSIRSPGLLANPPWCPVF